MGCKKGIPHWKWSKSEKLKLVKLHLEEHMSIREIERQYSVEHNILRSMSRVGTPTDNPIIEALNGWIKEELFLDFDLAHAKDAPNRRGYWDSKWRASRRRH